MAKHLKHDPRDPTGPIATASCCRMATASMLLYGLLHLTGYDLPIERAEALSATAFATRRDIPKSA